MNEGLFLCQLAADKSGANVMKLPLHNINLHCARPLAKLYIFLSRWLTYSLLVLHNVIPPMLLGEVRRQHIKAASKLREHQMIGVTCEGQYWMTTLYSGNWKRYFGEGPYEKENWFLFSFFLKYIWTRKSVVLCLSLVYDLSSYLTLPVDPESIQQLGATQLSTEQGYIELH